MISSIDLAIRIKNGYLAKKSAVEAPGSLSSIRILEKLVATGYVASFTVQEHGQKKTLVIQLKYDAQKPALSGVKIISKPGQREYVGVKDIPVVLNGLGLAILSTTRGILTSKEARKAGVGGEILFTVW